MTKQNDYLRDSTLDDSQDCRHKYQQSKIDVYARFIIQEPGEPLTFFKNKKTYVRVTGLVQGKFQVADENVAKIVGSTVMGVSAGKTDVQVHK